MGTLLTILITAAIAGWFGYSLYRMWRGASGRDCASCAWMKQPPEGGENGSGK